MMQNARLSSYLMTHDSGFAPNPFFGYLTLATCKPGMRRTKKKGDWIAGFASQALVTMSQHNGVRIPYLGLIYLMKVSDVLSFDEYFKAAKFERKKPSNRGDWKTQAGDNIYWSDGQGNFHQLRNAYHDESHKPEDTSGNNVLVAEEFYYFGRNCPAPPGSWSDMGVRVPSSQSPYGWISEPSALMNLLGFLQRRGFRPGVHGEPCLWAANEDDKTCRSCHDPEKNKTPGENSNRREVVRADRGC